jgi:two-component system chemotaxis sensor kinase CheA
MSNAEEEFLRRLRATFVVEAEEHVRAMSAGLLELEQPTPEERRAELLETVFRHAHSLKGAARATNFPEVESVCQVLESVLAAWKRGELAVSGGSFDVLHRAVDLIGALALGGERGSADQQALATVLGQLAEIASAKNVSAAPRAVGEAYGAPNVVRHAPQPAVSAAAAQAPIVPAGSRPLPVSAPPPAVETIRVSTAKLDRLLLGAEEMLVGKQGVSQRAFDVKQIELLLAQWTRRWAGLQPKLREWRDAAAENGAASAVGEFIDWNSASLRSLEGKIRELGKAVARDRHDIARRVDDLLDDAKQLVMLPFATLADLFPKLVRDLSRDQGKPVNFTLQGAELEVDKRILEEMKDPLVHLLRNCVDHGIEKPELRMQRGKPAAARVALTIAAAPGNKIELTIADDGAGLDLAKVKAAAVRRGLVSAEQAAALDDRQARDLIFQSEVSTSPIITEISGRGLGLAIVREKTDKLGGWVSVESEAGQGTRFRIVLPLTLATFRGVLVRVAGQTLVVPTTHIERVGRVKTSVVRTVENRETIELAGRTLAFVRLAEVLELETAAAPAADYLSFVVLGSGGERVAFVVDEVLHDEEVLAKAFTRPLVRVRNIAGATVLASGRVAPILNAADLIKSARRAGGTSRAVAAAAAGPARTKSILVAEDSITSRMLLKGILESAGYRVKTVVDGMEAWTAVRTEDFDLVVSDVEMPRMNGFDLTAHIRGDKKLADKPVVLVTALASTADRERGIDVGANAYIVKSNFNESSLLEVVRRLA